MQGTGRRVTGWCCAGYGETGDREGGAVAGYGETGDRVVLWRGMGRRVTERVVL